ncbi:NAD(P)/FAD-dependent oxidoreductase [Eoetvoesiella caeni]|uniref:3-phenylpropionate/trans-cinnamate dioxygenase ferredoxin reductase subunit n=1 Tax=Eoetvoesiella caeni TaxID=645616 RepID=A0A366HHY6_9BURK|nr:FAD-dependent oxidoreductase [Eoetvoesiella caeni]MCI2808254.1 FAD-dependent oxidoreductase [Eoetvoesiella caeni]RBP42179.1 3-phenylpropionate/trans-cinnamate dioxygenase ferredoxin reductase subunit [Eoetvoesiella caeni]
MAKKIVVVGSGHAGAQFCASVIESKEDVQLVLVGDEAHLPYQRPPLSKTYLKDPQPEAALLRAASFYSDNNTALQLASKAVDIDRQGKTIGLASGERLAYDCLVLAMGTRARTLPLFEGGYDNVFTLRTLDDAQRLRGRLQAAQNVLVIGGGFIGLEIAATSAQLGKAVTLLEAAPRLLGRSSSPEISSYLLEKHRATGVDIRLQTAADRIDVADNSVQGVWVGEDYLPADMVIVGIGAVPNDELARQAGLECDNGVVVDAYMRTSDPDILAIGDCTAFPSAALGRRIRLESVQNANDQARCAALTVAGKPQAYAALPWFWSDQGAVRIQIAGVPEQDHKRVVRGDPAQDKFSVLYFKGDILTSAESINSAADHIAARKLITLGTAITPAQAADAGVPLKDLMNKPA